MYYDSRKGVIQFYVAISISTIISLIAFMITRGPALRDAQHGEVCIPKRIDLKVFS